MDITTATIQEMDIVRTLFREYQQWLGVDLCFQNFEKELNELPGWYKEPEGAIFLAKEGGEIVGCVAIRPRINKEAELKRLYVSPKSQGKGYGKLLLAHALQVAHSAGYESVVLDTLPIMKAANRYTLISASRKLSPITIIRWKVLSTIVMILPTPGNRLHRYNAMVQFFGQFAPTYLC